MYWVQLTENRYFSHPSSSFTCGDVVPMDSCYARLRRVKIINIIKTKFTSPGAHNYKRSPLKLKLSAYLSKTKKRAFKDKMDWTRIALSANK